MNKITDLPYAPQHAFRGLGDLYLPDEPAGAPVALAIHGGGWNAMDKYSWSGVAEFLCRDLGFAVYNINYRLLSQAPWPACGDDCLAAANFLLTADHPALQQLDRSRGAVIIGGSAGGHLALMTGLRLPPAQARAIVSISGPSDFRLRLDQSHGWLDRLTLFFGLDSSDHLTPQMLADASPVSYVAPQSPPLLCVHSTNDDLVRPDQAEAVIRRYSAAGARAELFSFPGAGRQHGIWIEGSDPHRMIAPIEEAITAFLQTI